MSSVGVIDPSQKKLRIKWPGKVAEELETAEVQSAEKETTEAEAVMPDLDWDAIKEATTEKGASIYQVMKNLAPGWEFDDLVKQMRARNLVVRLDPIKVKVIKEKEDQILPQLDWKGIDKMLTDRDVSYTNDQIYEQYGKEMDFETFMNAVEDRKEELKLNTVPKNQRTRDTNMSNRLSEGATHGSGPSPF